MTSFAGGIYARPSLEQAGAVTPVDGGKRCLATDREPFGCIAELLGVTANIRTDLCGGADPWRVRIGKQAMPIRADRHAGLYVPGTRDELNSRLLQGFPFRIAVRPPSDCALRLLDGADRAP